MLTLSNFINNKNTNPFKGQYIDNYNPATGNIYCQIPDSSEEDLELAIRAAEQAFKTWSQSSLEERFDIMMNISRLIKENLSTLAEAECIDNGKPLHLAQKMDIPRAADNFQFFANAITQFHTHAYHRPKQALNYTLKQAIGIVGCISPWNLPLYLFTWKIAPAIAAGNCVIAKPSELTPMTAYLLGEICQKAGLPPGVLNIVHGRGSQIGQALIEHPLIKAISFTGGTETGKKIAATAAPMFKKLSLELGGKNPSILFADAHYDRMLDNTVRSSFTNQGQICLCGSRILVEKSIYQQFKNDFVKATKQLQLGDPLDKDTKIGAVVSRAHQNNILSYIDLAVKEGGKILCGGEKALLEGRCKEGYFIKPTIIEGLSPYCRTNQEEIFGPVVSIIPFENEEEMINYANCTPYGLSANLWTQDVSRVHRLVEKLDAGVIWVNTWLLRDLRTPFGGMKASGVGREGGFDALNFFTETKNICIYQDGF